jgi:predicted pyridoxine 5'-phosphate oxidase superfamily flavin-nucleotide-binding protein
MLTTLTNELIEFFDGEKLVLLGTVDAESGAPMISAISWVKCRDGKHIRFAVSSNSRIVTNILANPNVVLTLIGLGTVYSIYGKATILEKVMEGVAIKLTKLEVDVEKIYNSMFWGSKITTEPAFEKTYNVEKAKKLDDEVYAALMK